MYQAEFHYDKKVTHENIPYYDAIDFVAEKIRDDFKQANILTETEDIQILAAKPEKPRITRSAASRRTGDLSHDKEETVHHRRRHALRFSDRAGGHVSPKAEFTRNIIPSSDRSTDFSR